MSVIDLIIFGLSVVGIVAWIVSISTFVGIGCDSAYYGTYRQDTSYYNYGLSYQNSYWGSHRIAEEYDNNLNILQCKELERIGWVELVFELIILLTILILSGVQIFFPKYAFYQASNWKVTMSLLLAPFTALLCSAFLESGKLSTIGLFVMSLYNVLLIIALTIFGPTKSATPQKFSPLTIFGQSDAVRTTQPSSQAFKEIALSTILKSPQTPKSTPSQTPKSTSVASPPTPRPLRIPSPGNPLNSPSPTTPNSIGPPTPSSTYPSRPTPTLAPSPTPTPTSEGSTPTPTPTPTPGPQSFGDNGASTSTPSSPHIQPPNPSTSVSTGQ